MNDLINKLETLKDEYNNEYLTYEGFKEGINEAINLIKETEKNKWFKEVAELTKPKTNCGYKISDNLKF